LDRRHIEIDDYKSKIKELEKGNSELKAASALNPNDREIIQMEEKLRDILSMVIC
jgi:hypothetical protein